MIRKLKEIVDDFLYMLKRYRDYDPATNSYWEIVLLYPGVKAMVFHRLAHFLYKRNVPFIPRAISEFSRFITQIEIHPGATIGRGLVIDHGQGSGIGETAVVGNDVTMMLGAVLAARNFSRTKRHPTIEDGVFLGIGSRVLGNITIGAGSRIGANSVVLESCPPHSTIVGIPGQVVRQGLQVQDTNDALLMHFREDLSLKKAS